MKNTFVVLALLVIFGCDQSDQIVEAKLGDLFQIGYGKSVSLDNGAVTVTFTSIAEDSRCPEGAHCVWEGNARVMLTFSKQLIGLNTTLSPKDTVLGAYVIELKQVDPYPRLEVESKPEDYFVTVVVKKRS